MKYVLVIVICSVVLFALRNAVLLLLLPASTGWYFSEKWPRYQWLIFTSIYLVGLVFFFNAVHLSALLDFPQYVVGKQAEFNTLSGNSKLALPPLAPNAHSFLSFLPHALDIAFLQPHISGIHNLSYIPAIGENVWVLTVMILWLILHQPLRTIPPLFVCFIFFSMSVLILYGYTVTFSGAVVRYKSIILPLLITAFLCSLSWHRLSFKRGIKNSHL